MVSTRGTTPGRRDPSPFERRNRNNRRWGWLVAAIGLAGAVVFAASIAVFVVLLGAVGSIGSRRPWVAEPTIDEVIDGDTVVVRMARDRVTVRLLGIDTPETRHPTKPVQCFGHEASERTKALLPRGTVVRLEHDVEQHDVYGRLLAYVWRASDGLFVNLDLLVGGYGDVLSIAPNTFHAEEFRIARDDARAAPRGLWRTCGGPGIPAS